MPKWLEEIEVLERIGGHHDPVLRAFARTAIQVKVGRQADRILGALRAARKMADAARNARTRESSSEDEEKEHYALLTAAEEFERMVRDSDAVDRSEVGFDALSTLTRSRVPRPGHRPE